MAGLEPNDISYCCIYDDDPNNTSSTPDGDNNIYCEPGFAYGAGTDNYHLAFDSPCKNLGDNSVVDTGDVDMDSEGRKDDGYVDIGADEIYSGGGRY